MPAVGSWRRSHASPDWWGDFSGRRPALPERALCIYCYHVGQLVDRQMHAALVERGLMNKKKDLLSVAAVRLFRRLLTAGKNVAGR